MRKLLTGVCNNIVQNYDKIKLWKESFQEVTDGDVVLIAHNPTDEDVKALNRMGILYVNISDHSNETVNNSRLAVLSDFFRRYARSYQAALSTDVFDVVFKSDPFAKLDLTRYDLFVAGEGILHSEEPWNMDVMQKCFPSYVDGIKDKPIFCSGVIAGRPLALSSLFFDMVKLCMTSKKGHDIEDQAAMNIIINNNRQINTVEQKGPELQYVEPMENFKRLQLEYPKYRVKEFNLLDNWCIHLAVAGPTQFFEPWGFKQRIKDRYGITPNWEDFDIVHQFNRIPSINEKLTNK
jgi:hypothetical protein